LNFLLRGLSAHAPTSPDQPGVSSQLPHATSIEEFNTNSASTDWLTNRIAEKETCSIMDVAKLDANSRFSVGDEVKYVFWVYNVHNNISVYAGGKWRRGKLKVFERDPSSGIYVLSIRLKLPFHNHRNLEYHVPFYL